MTHVLFIQYVWQQEQPGPSTDTANSIDFNNAALTKNGIFRIAIESYQTVKAINVNKTDPLKLAAPK